MRAMFRTPVSMARSALSFELGFERWLEQPSAAAAFGRRRPFDPHLAATASGFRLAWDDGGWMIADLDPRGRPVGSPRPAELTALDPGRPVLLRTSRTPSISLPACWFSSGQMTKSFFVSAAALASAVKCPA